MWFLTRTVPAAWQQMRRRVQSMAFHDTQLTEATCLTVHSYMARSLDMWDFYTSLHLAVAGERLVGVSALTRELGRQHSDHANQWAAFLHRGGREVLLERLLGEEELLPYRRLMEEQRAEEGVLGMLEDRLEQAVHREERLFHLLMEEEAFKPMEGREEEVEQFTRRVEVLEHGLHQLAAVRSQGVAASTADLLIAERLLPASTTM